MTSTLSSASTDAEVEDAYADNASYAEDGSVAKARAFITACRLLLLRRPSQASKGGPGGAALEFDPTLYERQITQAEQYIAVNNTAAGSGVRYTDFADFRE